MHTEGRGVVNMCGFNGVRRNNCFVGEPVSRTGMEMRRKMFRNGKATGKD